MLRQRRPAGTKLTDDKTLLHNGLRQAGVLRWVHTIESGSEHRDGDAACRQGSPVSRRIDPSGKPAHHGDTPCRQLLCEPGAHVERIRVAAREPTIATAGIDSTAGSPRVHRTGGGSTMQLSSAEYLGSNHGRGSMPASRAAAMAAEAADLAASTSRA